MLRLKELTFFSIENMAFSFSRKYAAYQAVSFRRPWVINENCCMYRYEFRMTGTPKEVATRRTLILNSRSSSNFPAFDKKKLAIAGKIL